MQRLVLGHTQPHRRQVQDLSLLTPNHDRRYVCDVQGQVTAHTDAGAMLNYPIHRLWHHQMQGCARMPVLPTRLLAASVDS